MKCKFCNKEDENIKRSICSDCEIELLLNPPVKYFIGTKEYTREEYNRIINEGQV